MNAHLRYLKHLILDSFWFIPAIMLLASLLLAVLSAVVDRTMQAEWNETLPWVFWVDAEGARTILQVIAGSMIGATSLVFSMTLVALTLASSQLGPRLLAIFRADRMTQVALGVFVATLAYALLMLRLVRQESQSDLDLVPLASVTVAQLLTLCSLAVLIYFIHHLAELLEADTIVSHVGKALDHSVDSLFPKTDAPDAGTEHEEEARGASSDASGDEDARLSERFCMVVPAQRSGYVQTIARHHLVSLAEQADGRIELEVMAGDFLIAGQRLARFWPLDRADDELKESIRTSITIGPKRTQAEDLEYAVHALVEIALRALSPSLNDPFTAIACLNRISTGLSLAIGRRDPPLRFRGEDGTVRLVMPARGFIELLEDGFNDIRLAAVQHPAVLRALTERLASLAGLAADPERRAAIGRQGEAMRRALEGNLAEPFDRARVEEMLDRLDARLRRWDR